MIISYFNLTLYRKKDILMIEKILKECQISAPILITELEDSYRINITSDYEHWELDDKILKLFPGYEFTDNIGNGRKSIRIKVSREQSSNSTDGWGRPIENSINEIKFLIKKYVVTPMQFNPKIRVLFDDESREYYINILPGINRITNEKGFLILDEFRKQCNKEDSNSFVNILFKTPIEAFWEGLRKVDFLTEQDYSEFRVKRKRKGKNK